MGILEAVFELVREHPLPALAIAVAATVYVRMMSGGPSTP